MTMDFPTPTGILTDLRDLRHLALEKGNFAVALKVTELLGREVGLFALKKDAYKNNKVALDNLSEEDIRHLIEELEAKLKLDHCTGKE